ncbi:sigma 54-interacting transcriptional regulator [Brevibacillus borstelensis]|uniref:sigma-54-dependent Fis family transcriptional regulator n=1 Tax=Brevibacillus TaxID=55080 RepID=UPI0014907F71|nr:sigma 54-interacting transcriptional regulator [Brevibacillus borstelensis]MCC0566103.1 sigma 54-interacting transcriptional regulator [Brevibacillus borstelensis]MCM3472873.1 sigma 54-interacting transcriptional regulator [Brevibacillus borstelensis]MCM3560817.1 sigma 54-interacting transcriptional regulator [Brevibacillus borstelensis]MCM3624382.1 sigma 54-interacting transcriptional regulator [Brevibacillus borstelensis]MED2007563.1 sigma 54-interacting transcriptional regulator [Breviba
MSLLREFQEITQQVAEAISAALQIETEIVDDTMTIIAGTGKYKDRINTKEEGGEVNAGYLYGRVLTTNQPFFIEDARSDPSYDPSVLQGVTEELAELCTPIHYKGEVIGVIGLIAFTETQRRLLIHNRLPYLTFLQRMTELLTGKIAEQEAWNEWKKTFTQLETLIESIHEGIIAIDERGLISNCNKTAQQLIQKNKQELIGTPLQTIWADSPMLQVLETGVGYVEQEEIYRLGEHDMHFIVTARPIRVADRVAGVVASFRRMADMRRLAYVLTNEHKDLYFSEIIGKSRSKSLVIKQAEQVARGTSNILITGESGTGKGMIAAAIHSASNRRDGPFIIVNCGAIPEALLESELFGYVAGAFTGAKREGKAGKFELADGGTIFLDEIGDLPLHLQVKLLHVLQSKQVERVGSNQLIPVNIRVISATNKNLEEMVRNREFREDLYFRLNVIPLHMPPLRERVEDIPLLMDHFLAKYRELLGHPILDFTPEVRALFMHYHWPGNVRELENAIEYAVNMEVSPYIGLDSVPVRIRQHHSVSGITGPGEADQPLKERLQRHERQILYSMLQQYGYSLEAKKLVAEKLDIGLATLYRKLEGHKLLNAEKVF